MTIFSYVVLILGAVWLLIGCIGVVVPIKSWGLNSRAEAARIFALGLGVTIFGAWLMPSATVADLPQASDSQVTNQAKKNLITQQDQDWCRSIIETYQRYDGTPHKYEGCAKDPHRYLTAITDANKRISAEIVRKKQEKPSAAEPVLSQLEPGETIASKSAKIYIGKILRASTKLSQFNVADYLESDAQMGVALSWFSDWAKLVSHVGNYKLNKKQRDFVGKFKRQLSNVQVKSLPRIRDAYGPIARQRFWRHDVSVQTIGNRFSTIEFVAAAFALNSNVHEFQKEFLPVIAKMRFTKAHYKWFAQADKYTRMTFPSYGDSALIIWGQGAKHTVVR